MVLPKCYGGRATASKAEENHKRAVRAIRGQGSTVYEAPKANKTSQYQATCLQLTSRVFKIVRANAWKTQTKYMNISQYKSVNTLLTANLLAIRRNH